MFITFFFEECVAAASRKRPGGWNWDWTEDEQGLVLARASQRAGEAELASKQHMSTLAPSLEEHRTVCRLWRGCFLYEGWVCAFLIIARLHDQQHAHTHIRRKCFVSNARDVPVGNPIPKNRGHTGEAFVDSASRSLTTRRSDDGAGLVEECGKKGVAQWQTKLSIFWKPSGVGHWRDNFIHFIQAAPFE